MSFKVFIDGRAGTTGLRIAERLSLRDDISLIDIAEENRKDIDSRLACIYESDITILCLPDDGSKEIVGAVNQAVLKAGPDFESKNPRIIDASTAYRVAPDWVYGMPEIDEKVAIATASYVANPGCHATGFIMTVRPLVEAGILDQNAMISCYSLTGYSGGGKPMISDYSEDPIPEPLTAPRLYGLKQIHKHIPEMQKYSGMTYEPTFSPIVSRYYAGMLVGVPIPKNAFAKSANINDIYKVLAEYYDGRRLVCVREPGSEMSEENDCGYLSSNTFVNRDDLEIFVTGDDDKILLVSRYDNLGKGASGAAIQNMNIMLGLPEETGLIIGKQFIAV